MELLKSFYSYTPPTIKIIVESSTHKPFKYPDQTGKLIEYPTFFSNDTIKGKIIIELNKNKNVEHQGIKINLIGIIENIKDPSTSTKFYDDNLLLSPPDKINNEITQLDFSFPGNKQKEYETYLGSSVKVRYYLCATIMSMPKQLCNQFEIVILKPYSREAFAKEENLPLKLEIGVEKIIHVIFEVERSNYFLRDVIVGKVTFVEVNLPIRFMEIQIVRKENLNFASAFSSETTIMSKYQLMDGTPTNDSSIPFRYYLNGVRALTPSHVNVDNKFSVQYFLHLEFVDFEDRRFFKRMEINIKRLNNMNRKELILIKKNKLTS